MCRFEMVNWPCGYSEEHWEYCKHAKKASFLSKTKVPCDRHSHSSIITTLSRTCPCHSVVTPWQCCVCHGNRIDTTNVEWVCKTCRHIWCKDHCEFLQQCSCHADICAGGCSGYGWATVPHVLCTKCKPNCPNAADGYSEPSSKSLDLILEETDDRLSSHPSEKRDYSFPE